MNKNFLRLFSFVLLALAVGANIAARAQKAEKHRPLFHFSPKQHWMNDPNGMVYHNGVYHLFYQYYPKGTVWGPMHWGHATSGDLVHWREKQIALYPDSLGYIFSGSIVVDRDNTSGFARNGKVAMVAIFTHHDPKKEAKKAINTQSQSIAYSLDDGQTWTKYAGNPVLPNPGISDFRDPKVMWHGPTKKWIMTLATKDRVTFYSSIDLKQWKRESEFGNALGAQGGVWECPDLFPLEYGGKTVWVLLVSINPGGPNGGSATQYFTGSFDGSSFTAHSTREKWLDYGTDNYAGVTWSNTGKRKIFIGWMNNWQYADKVPTKAWRGAATIARDLSLCQFAGELYVRSVPVKELRARMRPVYKRKSLIIDKLDLSPYAKGLGGKLRLELNFDSMKSLEIVLSNKNGDWLLMGYDAGTKTYYIDRKNSGEVGFEKGFGVRHLAPRISVSKDAKIDLLLDAASVELFADGGLSVMTDVFFPNGPIDGIKLSAPKKQKLSDLVLSAVNISR